MRSRVSLPVTAGFEGSRRDGRKVNAAFRSGLELRESS